MPKRMWLSAIVFATAIAAAPAADLHVSPHGPCTDIQAAINAAQNGDTVTIADGTWTPAGGFLTIDGKNITLRSLNGPVRCTFLRTRLYVSNTTEGDIRIQGLKFRCKPISISAEKVHSLVIEDCIMEQTIRALYAVSTTCQLYRCRIRRAGMFYDAGNWLRSSDDIAAVNITGSPGTTVLDGCVISQVRGSGLSIGAPDAILRSCIFTSCSQRAISAPIPVQLTNCTIIDNAFGLATKNDLAVIVNCIFWGNRLDIAPFYMAGDLDRPESITVRNSYLMHGWPGENIYRDDPKITREGWLQAGSPCIDAGIPASDAAADVDGEARVQNEVVDIGADEYQDQDGDGLPDHWEARYFNSPTAAIADNDDDNDGLTNREEYTRGSHPMSTYWYVDAIRHDNSGDGRSWQTAKKTITAATMIADDGDIVLVADGWYYDDHAFFWGRPIWIKSANGPANCRLNAPIVLHGHEGADFILDGFTIQGGGTLVSVDEHGTPTIQNCVLSNAATGIDIISAGAIIRNCTIAGNSDSGILMTGDNPHTRMLRVERCKIYNNIGDGIVACHYRTTFPLVTLRDCFIHHNGRAGVWGWAVFDVDRCRFEGNGSCGFGVTSPDVVVRNCVITGNCWSPWHLPGLGISSPSDRPAKRLLVENCTIARNVGGGGIGGYAQGPQPHQTIVNNCIIRDNLIDWVPGEFNIKPNVSYAVTNCNIRGEWQGSGNIDQEPFFANPGYFPDEHPRGMWVSGDYRLLSISPCINAGDPAYVAAQGETDAAGNPRVLHGRIDIGAYEKASADFSPDAQIDRADLLWFADHWLDDLCEEPGWCAGADLTLDGRVDERDFARLAAEWSHSTRDPIAWYRFDETSGTVAADNSLFNNVAILYNTGADRWVPGKIGNALYLGQGGYAKVFDSKPPLGAQSRTVTAWIKTTVPSGDIVSWGAAGTPGARWTFAIESPGRIRVEVGGGIAEGTRLIWDGLWHHVAAVFENDGTPNINDVILYVDGTPELLTAQGDRAINTLPGDLCIGQSSSSTRSFSGLIDDVRIYNRALTPEEIAKLAQ